jgi:predicted nucleic acid-binding protein
MPDKVADASVVASMIFWEPRADEAAALLAGVRFVEPRLLPYELANAGRRKIIDAVATQADVEYGLITFMRGPLRWIEQDALAVLRLSVETGLSTYDASYLHLAQALNLPLVTFDERLSREARRRGVPA